MQRSCIEHLKNINKKDDWQTPRELYDKLDRKYHFTFDPCPVNPTFDGLHIKWHGSVFCNPPYSEVEKWISKGVNAIVENHVTCVVYLVYAKTDTKWFHKYIWNRDPNFPSWTVDFIKGRVKFCNPVKKEVSAAPYPSMILVWEKKNDGETNIFPTIF